MPLSDFAIESSSDLAMVRMEAAARFHSPELPITQSLNDRMVQ